MAKKQKTVQLSQGFIDIVDKVAEKYGWSWQVALENLGKKGYESIKK